jgi:transcription elongation GreA/GreB family factor
MKEEILKKIRVDLKDTLDRLVKAAMDAHAAATDPGSKAESKYDTRNLEASYLATGQARQVEELAEAVRIFDGLVLPEFSMDDAIDAGALVEVDSEGESQFYLLVPAAGGLVVSHEGAEITLLSPDSLLYRRLIGLKAGDELESPPLMVLEIS